MPRSLAVFRLLPMCHGVLCHLFFIVDIRAEGYEKSGCVRVFENPLLFLKWSVGDLKVFFDAKTPFFRIFFGGILLDCTSKVSSFPPIQPLLMMSPHSEIHALLCAPPKNQILQC